jgi:hypothetical protein
MHRSFQNHLTTTFTVTNNLHEGCGHVSAICLDLWPMHIIIKSEASPSCPTTSSEYQSFHQTVNALHCTCSLKSPAPFPPDPSPTHGSIHWPCQACHRHHHSATHHHLVALVHHYTPNALDMVGEHRSTISPPSENSCSKMIPIKRENYNKSVSMIPSLIIPDLGFSLKH